MNMTENAPHIELRRARSGGRDGVEEGGGGGAGGGGRSGVAVDPGGDVRAVVEQQQLVGDGMTRRERRPPGGDQGARWPGPGVDAAPPDRARPDYLPGARGTPAAQRQVLSAPDGAHQRGSGLEGDRGIDGYRKTGRCACDEAELVGDAAAGEGVHPCQREPRLQAQRALETFRSWLVGRDPVGAGGIAGRRGPDRSAPPAPASCCPGRPLAATGRDGPGRRRRRSAATARHGPSGFRA